MIEIDHTVETDEDKILDPTIGDNHRTDVYNLYVTVGEEVIDIKIMIIKIPVEIEGDKTLDKTSVMTDMTIGIGARDRSLTPRTNHCRRHHSPNAN